MTGLNAITGSTQRSWASLIGVLMVPILMAGILLTAAWDSSSRWGNVEAAIVNNDKPVRVNGQLVPLGRQLAGGLADPDDNARGTTKNLDWVISNPDDAAGGLADGRYAVVITIPETFSADATSFTGNDSDTARHATVDVQTSPAAGITDAAVADAISAAAIATLNKETVQSYLQNLYLQFNEVQRRMKLSADGSDELANGASDMGHAIRRSASAGDTLAAGLDRQSNGVADMADGLRRTDTSTRRLAAGAGALAHGVRQTHDGAVQLHQGAAQLDQRVTTYRGAIHSFVDGLGEYTEGVDAYIEVVDPIAVRVRDLAADVEQLLPAVDRAAARIALYVEEMRDYAGRVGDYIDGANQHAQDVARFIDSIGPTVERGADSAIDEASTLCTQRQLTAEQCQIFTSGMEAGADRAADLAKQALVGTGTAGQPSPGEQVVASTTRLTTTGKELTESGGAIINSIEQLSIDAQQLSDGGEQLTSLPARIRNGADQLVRSGDELGVAGRRVTDGANRLLSGVMQFDGGISALHDGSSRLVDATGRLADRADQLGDGAAMLSNGFGRLAGEGAELEDGANQLAAGAHRLTNGLGRLNDNGKLLADGADQLANALQHGADRVPTFTEPDRYRLAAVASQPISSSRPDQQFTNESTGTLLMALALWIGALATYLVVRAIGSDAFGAAKTSARLALEGVLPAAAIGSVLTLILSGLLMALLKLSIGQTVGLLCFGLLAATTFAALNHALTAWLGGPGRLISFTMAVLVAACALTDAVPGILTTALPYLPITPAIEGSRMIISHGSSVGHQVATLLGWLVIGTILSTVAVARRRVAYPVALLAPAQRPRHWPGGALP